MKGENKIVNTFRNINTWENTTYESRTSSFSVLPARLTDCNFASPQLICDFHSSCWLSCNFSRVHHSSQIISPHDVCKLCKISLVYSSCVSLNFLSTGMFHSSASSPAVMLANWYRFQAVPCEPSDEILNPLSTYLLCSLQTLQL